MTLFFKPHAAAQQGKQCMKLLKKLNSIFSLAFVGYLLFSIVPTAQGFIAFHQRYKTRLVLMASVHEESWTIGYMYSEKCAAKDRPNDKELQRGITEALQTWLQPLRDYTKRPIVNDFRFVKLRDWNEQDLRFDEEFKKLAVRFGFICDLNNTAFAQVGTNLPPDITMSITPQINLSHREAILHELGHAMGLDDTYIRPNGNEESSGGLPFTRGTQPRSVMAGRRGTAFFDQQGRFQLGDDDRRGIIWLYKHLHEGLVKTDCFFSDYAFEETPAGCRPKYPLLFEFKQDIPESQTLDIVRHDKNIDLNARDRHGMTALHYAVQLDYEGLLKVLLKQPSIKVNIVDNAGQTAAQFARKLRKPHFAKFIEAHSTAKLAPWAVAPVGKLTTTWGRIKQRTDGR